MPIDSDSFKKGYYKLPNDRISKEKLKVSIEEVLDDCQARSSEEIIEELKADKESANQVINDLLNQNNKEIAEEMTTEGVSNEDIEYVLKMIEKTVIVIIVIGILNEMVKEDKLESSDVETTNGYDRYYIKKSCLY